MKPTLLDRAITRIGCFGGATATAFVTWHGWGKPNQLDHTIVATVCAAVCGWCWSRLEDEPQ